MSEMSERAAKAICETLFGQYDSAEADRSDASISGQSRMAARAAIEAMREPTKGMLHGSKRHMDSWSSNLAWWESMIDEALR